MGELAAHSHDTYGQNPRINDDVGSTLKWGHDSTKGDWWFQTVASAVKSTGSSNKHNNIQPYCIVFYYRRTK